LHIEPGRHLHSDDAVFVEVVQRHPARRAGGNSGEWQQASVRIACQYEFDEDRLACERVWFDFATIMRQLDVLTS
jgi:hypothetical protein